MSIIATVVVLTCVSAQHVTIMRQAPTANVQGTLHESLFTKVLTAATPEVVDILRNATFPGVQSPHFTMAPFKFSAVDMRYIGVDFAAPDVVTAVVEGLSLTLPPTNFSIDATIVGINLTCAGHVKAYVGPTNITVALRVSTLPTQRLNFSSGNTTVVYTNVTIEQSMDSLACQLSEDIIEAVIGNINQLLDKTLKQDLPLLVTPLSEYALNTICEAIPLAIVGDPVVADDGITVTVDLIGSLSMADEPFDDSKDPYRRWKTTKGGDVVLTTPQNSINALLQFVDVTRHIQTNITIPPNILNSSSLAQLFPGIAKVCVNCVLVLDVNATEMAPSVAMGHDAVQLTVTDLYIGISALDPRGPLDALFAISVNASFSVVNLTTTGPLGNVVWFQLAMDGFAMSLVSTHIGPVDIAGLSPVVALLLKAVLIPDFNKQFHGLALPPPLEDIAIDVDAGVATVAFDVSVG